MGGCLKERGMVRAEETSEQGREGEGTRKMTKR